MPEQTEPAAADQPVQPTVRPESTTLPRPLDLDVREVIIPGTERALEIFFGDA
ncbi:hypothetical protein ACIBO6_02035 [Streptomyces luteogriseus]|jgi:hypothetical protein|uniref:hypothetical protein n=1 Tax=Streptomyces luteogriseus TaxID=68233 RepID=UPI0037B6C6D5